MSLFDRPGLRVAVLDVEASGFGSASYPIEVGVALIIGTAVPIRLWDTLIRPPLEWSASGLWSAQSAEVHGISRDDVAEGMSVADVCDRLNTLLHGAIVVTDAPSYDRDWLERLYVAAGKKQTFILHDFDLLSANLNHDEYRQFVYLLDRSSPPHRAGADALRLASALLEARLSYPPQVEHLKS